MEDKGGPRPPGGVPISLEEITSLGIAFAHRTLRRKQSPIEVRIKAPGVEMYLNGVSSYSPHINRLWP